MSRWWIALTLLGPLTALAIMTTDRSYNRFTDLLTMAQFFYSSLFARSLSPETQGPHDFYRLILYLLPVATFAGIAAALQAFALKGAVSGAA